MKSISKERRRCRRSLRSTRRARWKSWPGCWAARGSPRRCGKTRERCGGRRRQLDDKPTIGILLVKGKNKTVVEYSLAGYNNPIGVADWENQLFKTLPDDLKSSLPTIEEIEKELDQ
ncbi:MAG: DUF1016 family protein [Lachnospiraceae bacterium]|nr:DUF1016 family protein [Lachnospiraceae bacterium]